MTKNIKMKSENGKIILPIRDGKPVFNEIGVEGIDLSQTQLLYLLALAYSYLELELKGQAIIANEPVPNITEPA